MSVGCVTVWCFFGVVLMPLRASVVRGTVDILTWIDETDQSNRKRSADFDLASKVYIEQVAREVWA